MTKLGKFGKEAILYRQLKNPSYETTLVTKWRTVQIQRLPRAKNMETATMTSKTAGGIKNSKTKPQEPTNKNEFLYILKVPSSKNSTLKLNGSINNVSATFQIDTGATQSFISKGLIENLILKRSQ